MNWNRLSAFLKANRGTVGVLVASGLIGLWFLIRLVADVLYFDDSASTDVRLKKWMTPKYIALTYDLPRPVILESLGLPADFSKKKRLGPVADELGVSLDELTRRVRQAAADHRARSDD